MATREYQLHCKYATALTCGEGEHPGKTLAAMFRSAWAANDVLGIQGEQDQLHIDTSSSLLTFSAFYSSLYTSWQ
ncbi:hypothetical protein NDU88_002199, partial [Pleurodeles waltl]